MEKNRENCVEWIWGQERATVTLSSPKHITRIENLAQTHPEVDIYKRNADGTIVAHIPVGYIKFNPPKNMSEEQKLELKNRMRLMNKTDSCN